MEWTETTNKTKRQAFHAFPCRHNQWTGGERTRWEIEKSIIAHYYFIQDKVQSSFSQIEWIEFTGIVPLCVRIVYYTMLAPYATHKLK